MVEVKLQRVLQADQHLVQQCPPYISVQPEGDGVEGVDGEGDKSGGGDIAGRREVDHVAAPVDGAGAVVTGRALQSW